MNDVVVAKNRITAMSETAIDKVRHLEAEAAKFTQIRIDHDHILHGGMYARSIMIPAGVMLTGALIKVATVLVVSGHVCVYIDGVPTEMSGYNVLAASAGRKQAFVALTDTHMTMVFASKAASVADAENEFTDEAHLLMSRADGAVNTVMVTGE